MTMKMKQFNADTYPVLKGSKKNRFGFDTTQQRSLIILGAVIIVLWIGYGVLNRVLPSSTSAQNNVAQAVETNVTQPIPTISQVVAGGVTEIAPGILKGSGRNFEKFQFQTQPLDVNAVIQPEFEQYKTSIEAGISPEDAGLTKEQLYEDPSGPTCNEVVNADGTVTRCGVRFGYPTVANQVVTAVIPDHCYRWSLANYYYGNCPNLK